MEMGNQSTVSYFIIQGFALRSRLQVSLLLTIILIIYISSLVFNIIIILIVYLDHRLHTPMYVLLSNLAFQDIWFISSTVLKMLICLAEGNNIIFFTGCILQMYFYLSLGSTEFLLLGAMSVDRYVAICHPLHYNVIMTQRRCIQFALGCWIGGFSCFLIPVSLIPMIPFCGSNSINHFFCDYSAVIKLMCSTSRWFELLFSSIASTVILSSLLITVISYAYIITSILRIPSASGRRKAFSTCASHFTVVSIIYGSCIFIYVRPPQSSLLDLTKVVAILNSVITPLLNPLIYTLRNNNIKVILRETVTKIFLKMQENLLITTKKTAWN
ncbi:olfactory receptor 6M1-like [Microcaecilia unicolor]|uniref:Olfactory receptor n=1 Tax=Microcaecilia unicolor TaxID=1415580 RepID=A0A6P7WMS5_9AMPH|nr:olfactory receptor 6M1-like [Microcaecilia unicolor]